MFLMNRNPLTYLLCKIGEIGLLDNGVSTRKYLGSEELILLVSPSLVLREICLNSKSVLGAAHAGRVFSILIKLESVLHTWYHNMENPRWQFLGNSAPFKIPRQGAWDTITIIQVPQVTCQWNDGPFAFICEIDYLRGNDIRSPSLLLVAVDYSKDWRSVETAKVMRGLNNRDEGFNAGRLLHWAIPPNTGV